MKESKNLKKRKLNKAKRNCELCLGTGYWTSCMDVTYRCDCTKKKKKIKYVKINLNIDDNVYMFLKKASQETGDSISSIIRFLLWQHIQIENEKCSFKK